MKKLFILAGLLWFASCTKKADTSVTGESKANFFTSNDHALAEVRNSERSFKRNEEVLSIQHISYLSEPGRDHAIVFYKTPKGDRSVIISKPTGEEATLKAASYTHCEGETCNCLVNATIHPDGTLDMKCSCTSCSMITTSH